MPSKKSKPEILETIRLATQSEVGAVAFFEAQRWPTGAACPLCGSVNVYAMTGRDGERNKDFRWRCRDCKKMFTVRTGTLMEETRLPLRIWLHAYWRGCASKKGVSALQISRECEISYKSALFLMHRIRYAMKDESPAGKLDGVVEADETFVGGKPRNTRIGRPGRYTKKVPVVAMVERGGKARAMVVANVTSASLRDTLYGNVAHTARLVTDDYRAYKDPARYFEGGHDSINHRARVYAIGDGHTNTVESFFSLIKRGIYGTFHSVSKHHLHRYVDEFTFRHNTRKMHDGERVAAAISGAEGKRLVYRQASETE
jgi:transposase-like protein